MRDTDVFWTMVGSKTCTGRRVTKRVILLAQVVGFSEFLGNEATVRQLRLSIGSGRLPQAMILAGSAGAGKYTLALMVAKAMNCTDTAELASRGDGGLPDFCGECRNCVQIAASTPLSARFDEAVAARDELRRGR